MTQKYVIGASAKEVHFTTLRLRPRARPLPTPVTSPVWYALATNPQCEEKAQEGLTALGYATLLPLHTFWKRLPEHKRKKTRGPDGRIRATGPKKEKVCRPLFPGYLFVGKNPEHSFEGAKLTDGVCAILTHGNEYIRIPDKAMNYLIARQADGTDDETIKTSAKFLELIGKPVVIQEGTFAGFVASVEKASRLGCELVIEFMGKRVKLSATLEDVVAA